MPATVFNHCIDWFWQPCFALGSRQFFIFFQSPAERIRNVVAVFCAHTNIFYKNKKYHARLVGNGGITYEYS